MTDDPNEQPSFRTNDGARYFTPQIVKGHWYPEMPPALPGETDEQYTDRLTGADGTDRRPYDHRRYRQCSIGYHGECSDRNTPARERICQCPCHTTPPNPIVDLNNLDDNQWEGLCDLVHEQASQLASNAINAGECVEWLVLNGWTTEDIIDRLKEKG